MIKKIISGGLPGVESAALDAAIKLGIPHKGWTYRRRKTEADASTEQYNVREIFNPSYFERLEKNIIDNPAIMLVPEFIPDEAVQLYMNACDICVLPYKHITTSGAAALCLSFGRPIIAPAINCFPELITPKAGILYDPIDQDALTSALSSASTRCWSESIIFNYAHQFHWEKLGPELNTLYR